MLRPLLSTAGSSLCHYIETPKPSNEERHVQRGPCWGRRPSEASSTSGQADDFSSCAASVTRGSFRNTGLTETLMLFRLCELCCAGVAHRGNTRLQCRRHRRLHLGDESSKEPEALRAGREHLVWGRWQHGRDVPRGTTRPEQDPRQLRYRRCGAP
jgi:hypothetical protein